MRQTPFTPDRGPHVRKVMSGLVQNRTACLPANVVASWRGGVEEERKGRVWGITFPTGYVCLKGGEPWLEVQWCGQGCLPWRMTRWYCLPPNAGFAGFIYYFIKMQASCRSSAILRSQVSRNQRSFAWGHMTQV